MPGQFVPVSEKNTRSSKRSRRSSPVALLCGLCGVSRSGYYKWRKRGGDPPKDRARVLRLVRECHGTHPSHGYRWVHAYLKKNDGVEVSAEYIRRCFLYLGIRAETKHQKKSQGRKVRDPYPNLVFSTWETVDRPRQVVVSDMTAFWTRSRYWELAPLLRRVHEADHRARAHEETGLAGHLPRWPRAGEGGVCLVQFVSTKSAS